jgi:hypothetical protein
VAAVVVEQWVAPAARVARVVAVQEVGPTRPQGQRAQRTAAGVRVVVALMLADHYLVTVALAVPVLS